ncbi:MAG: hypothetical protein ACI4HI_06100 [Lachnospiraceae bacterium]
MEKQEKELSYLSDEELQNLIADVEAHHMLQAPSYLKAEILTQAQQMKEKQLPAVEQNRKPVQLRQKRKQQLFFYRLKVSAAAAAAILLLFCLPNVEKQLPQNFEQKPSITRRLAETSGNWCEQMNRFSDFLISGSKKEIR